MLAIERLKQYLSADPDNADLAGELLDACFHAGRYADVAAVLNVLAPSVSDLPGIQFRHAQLDLAQGHYRAATDRLSSLWLVYPESLAIGHDLAFAHLCHRRLDDARVVLAAVEARHPQAAVLRVLSARVELMAGNFLGAQTLLDAVTSVESRNVEALGLGALCRLDAGDMAGAAAAASACLELAPHQHEALLVAGAIALAQQQPRAAAQHFSNALERHPNSGRALSGLGQVQMLGEQLEDARQTLQLAVAAMPDHIGTWHALAWSQLLLSDLHGAEASYHSALSLDRNFGESHGGLAVVQVLTERFVEGEASMKRSLKLDPACITGRYAKSLWLHWCGKEAESTAVFAELLAQNALPAVQGQDASVMAERLRAQICSRVIASR